MLRLSASEAHHRLNSSPFPRWGGRIDEPETSVGSRSSRGTFVPSLSLDWTKDLSLSSEDSVFAIGSCFARGIEQSLVSSNLDVLSYASEFDSFELSNPSVTGRGFTNKYSTFAIANEVGWALDPTMEFPTESLVQVAPDRVIDPHVNPTLKWLAWQPTLDRRAIITDVYSRIPSARVLIITLGLVESWFDGHSGIYLNMTPTREMIELDPDRYVFEVTGFEQNRAQLDALSALLRRTCPSELQIVVTVSPVPLNATFSGRDVVAANAYSKAVLRAAAEEWCFDEPNVHYFPSYEIVTTSDSSAAWETDGRHVRGPIVQDIMGYFKASFVDRAHDAPTATADGWKAQSRLGKAVKRVVGRSV